MPPSQACSSRVVHCRQYHAFTTTIINISSAGRHRHHHHHPCLVVLSLTQSEGLREKSPHWRSVNLTARCWCRPLSGRHVKLLITCTSSESFPQGMIRLDKSHSRAGARNTHGREMERISSTRPPGQLRQECPKVTRHVKLSMAFLSWACKTNHIETKVACLSDLGTVLLT